MWCPKFRDTRDTARTIEIGVHFFAGHEIEISSAKEAFRRWRPISASGLGPRPDTRIWSSRLGRVVLDAQS